jgi:hypothetical protein
MRVDEGDGWRLVLDPQRHPFPLLIGGEQWATELTGLEALALQRVMRTLMEQHRALTDTLLAEESINLEMELELFREEAADLPRLDPPTAEQGSDQPCPPALLAGNGTERGLLWAELEGNREHWSVRFILSPGPDGRRALEAGWSEQASAAVLAALLQLDGLQELVGVESGPDAA